MLSILLLLVLGLVIVVPRLACRPWPRLKGVVEGLADGDVGLPGEPVGVSTGEVLVLMLVGGGTPAGTAARVIASSIPAEMPLGVTGGGWISSEGVIGRELERMAWPSSDSAS